MCTYSDDKNPFDQGEAEATDGSVAPCDGIGQTEGQAEPDPVEQEGHWWGGGTLDKTLATTKRNAMILFSPAVHLTIFILKKAGEIFKIKDNPVRYLWNTLHSSETSLLL